MLLGGRSEAEAQGLPAPTALLLQLYSGISNAAPSDCPIMQLTDSVLPGAVGDGAPTTIHDALCDVTFRISPMSFFQA
jgi:hypothetical protein